MRGDVQRCLAFEPRIKTNEDYRIAQTIAYDKDMEYLKDTIGAIQLHLKSISVIQGNQAQQQSLTNHQMELFDEKLEAIKAQIRELGNLRYPPP